jgi:hypothetical protein
MRLSGLRKASLDPVMTRIDRKILFTALAFFAVAGKGGAAEKAEAAEDIRKLASLAESFCAEHVGSPWLSASSETGEQAIDEMIGRHIAELRNKELTHLPSERATLIDLHDRLAQRKARRQCGEFYDSVSDETLADAVLALLDEEISRIENLT